MSRSEEGRREIYHDWGYQDATLRFRHHMSDRVRVASHATSSSTTSHADFRSNIPTIIAGLETSSNIGANTSILIINKLQDDIRSRDVLYERSLFPIRQMLL